MATRNVGTHRIKVWDLPVRFFHWSLAALVGLAWWSGTQHRLDVHRMAGYSILALVFFRILWGFFGSTTARFAHFLARPAHVLRYIDAELFQRKQSAHNGHNPLGGWSVAALVGTLLIQVLLGLVAVDIDGLESGPLSYLVSFETGRIAARLHAWIFDALLVLITAHIAAIGFYFFYKRQNLTAAMIHGYKRFDESVPAAQIPSRKRALGLFVCSCAVVLFLVQFLGR